MRSKRRCKRTGLDSSSRRPMAYSITTSSSNPTSSTIFFAAQGLMTFKLTFRVSTYNAHPAISTCHSERDHTYTRLLVKLDWKFHRLDELELLVRETPVLVRRRSFEESYIEVERQTTLYQGHVAFCTYRRQPYCPTYVNEAVEETPSRWTMRRANRGNFRPRLRVCGHEAPVPRSFQRPLPVRLGESRMWYMGPSRERKRHDDRERKKPYDDRSRSRERDRRQRRSRSRSRSPYSRRRRSDDH